MDVRLSAVRARVRQAPAEAWHHLDHHVPNEAQRAVGGRGGEPTRSSPSTAAGSTAHHTVGAT
eukprot:4161702-Heterocapsa_arctica.AAC.1